MQSQIREFGPQTMRLTALLAMVAARAAGAEVAHVQSRIVNGVPVTEGKYPFMVQLYETYCGGSVIDKNWVLTAAHCGYQEKILLGAHRTYPLNEGEGAYLQVTANFQHPRYDPISVEYDFQLLYIAEGIDLETFPAILVDGLNAVGNMQEGTTLNIAGWGLTESEGPSAEVLLESTVDVVSQNSCIAVYGTGNVKITDDMFCGINTVQKSDTCQGDSGGPVFGLNDDGTVTQYGVVSFGHGCAVEGYPGVYGRVSYVSSWIREILNEGVECVDYAYDCCVKTWENEPYPELGHYYEFLENQYSSLSSEKGEGSRARHLLFGDAPEGEGNCPTKCQDFLFCAPPPPTPFECDDGCKIHPENLGDSKCDCTTCEDEANLGLDCETCGGCPDKCGDSVQCNI